MANEGAGPAMIEELWRLFAEHLSVQDAIEHGRRIWEEQRWCSAERDRRAVEYCLDAMRNVGLSDVDAIELPADGKTSFGGVRIPKLWNVRSAVLESLEPERAVIADYTKEPCHLMLYSAPTGPEGIELRIEKEGEPGPEGTLFENISRDEAHDALVSGRAAFVISDHIFRDQPADRGAIQWHNFTINPFYTSEARGFAISRGWGDRIRTWLSQGKRVRLRARVDAETRDGKMRLPTAVVPGASDEEILLTGHMYEMGADDNSFGCGLCVEVMGMIARLVAEGTLPRPKRTIRVLLSFEARGNQAYAYMYPERRTSAGIVVDSVAADRRFPIHVFRSPVSSPSFADYFLMNLVKRAAEASGYSWGTSPLWNNDNAISDPQIGTSIPGLTIFDEGEYYYHNSLDRPDVISPETMQLTGAITATYVYYLACASSKEIRRLADLAMEGLIGEGVTEWKARKVFDSLARFGGHDSASYLARRVKTLSGIRFSPTKTPEVQSDLRASAESIVPKRHYMGFTGFDDLTPDQVEDYKRTAGVYPRWISPVWLNEVLFLADGTVSLWQIFEILTREGLELDLEMVNKSVLMMSRLGKVDLM